MTTLCPVDGCGAQVLEALDPAGSIIRLNSRPSPRGKIAAAQGESGRWYARLLRPGELPGEDEKRFNPHTCSGRGGGLAEVRQAQSRHAHEARTQRGRWRPKDGNPFGRASGVQIPPPGGAA